MFKVNSKVSQITTPLYSALIALHVLHSFLERHESASFIINWYKNYYIYSDLEIVAFVTVTLIFILYLIRIKWAYYASIIYSIVMILDGLYHILTIIKENQHLDTMIGTFITSIGFILIGIALTYYLIKNKIYFSLKTTLKVNKHGN